MKATIIIGGFLSLISPHAVAQQAENDDMYFTAKDREKLRVTMAETPTVAINTTKSKQKDIPEEVTQEDLNPTDSYSARTINPEYISRANAEKASEDEQNYYLEGYTATNTYDSYSASQFSNTSNCGTCWNSYPNSYYGGSAWDYYSPYYGYSNPWRTPYYGMSPGWNMSLSYLFGGWGSGWNMGLSYTWGNSYYNNPYYYNPYYYNPYGYTRNYSNSGYQYVPVSQHENGVVKRTRTVAVTPSQRVSSINNTTDTNGRMRSSNADEYYVKPSRRISQSTDYSNPLYRQNSTSEYQRSRSTNSNGFERFMNDSSPSRSSGSSSFERSRSSSPSFSSPSRSSGGGSSGGTRSRGRN